MNRQALTVVEVVVVLAIIGILMALLLPAVQAARESARNTSCKSNLRQIALAIHQYEDVHGILPRAMRKNYSFHVALLPHLEQEVLFRRIDFSMNAGDYTGPLREVRVKVFECPSDSASRNIAWGGAATNYFGNAGSGAQRYGFNGVFGSRSHPIGAIDTLSLASITDGLSNTALLAETLPPNGSFHRLRVIWLAPPLGAPAQLEQFASACAGMPESSFNHFTHNAARGRPWMEGSVKGILYNHVLPPNSPSCLNGTNVASAAFSSASAHEAFANVAHADGSIHSVGPTIDIDAWRRLASRAGNP